MLLKNINYNVTREEILRIDEFTMKDIELAIELTEKKWTNLLEHYDRRTSCLQQDGGIPTGN